MKLDLICLWRRQGPQMLFCYVVMFYGACQCFFLLAKFGRMTDGHVKNIRMFFEVFKFSFFCL